MKIYGLPLEHPIGEGEGFTGQIGVIQIMSTIHIVFSFFVWEVNAVGKISDCQPGGPGFNPWTGRGSNFGQPSFTTPSVDRDVNPLV